MIFWGAGGGCLLAISMSQAKWIERSLYPYVVVVQVTPILAIVPLIALWFGYDFTARVVVCVMISIFPIVTNTLMTDLEAARRVAAAVLDAAGAPA